MPIGRNKWRRGISIRARLLPIIFFVNYLNFTVLLFALGPWPWPIADGGKLYVFLALAHSALLLGYLSAAFGQPRKYSGQWKFEHIFAVSLAVNLILLFPTSAFRTGSVIPDIAAGLADPGTQYFTTNAIRAEGGGLAEYLRILLGPILFLLLPLTLFYWQRLNWLARGLAILQIAMFLGIYVAIGTNKAIADFVLLTPCLLMASWLAGHLRVTRRNLAAGFMITVLLLVGFFSFFTTGQLSRSRSITPTPYLAVTDTFADLDNFMVRDLPPEAQFGVIALTSYLTQGYNALNLSLDQPFVPMWGVGNSMFLYFNAVKLTGNQEIAEMPYPVRLQSRGEWDAYGNWATIYPWIASDVSFPGTIVVVFLIGRVFALVWIDSLEGSNPFAVAMLAQFAIMLFYFSANNQVLQSGESFTSFWGLFALWLATRVKMRRVVA